MNSEHVWEPSTSVGNKKRRPLVANSGEVLALPKVNANLVVQLRPKIKARKITWQIEKKNLGRKNQRPPLRKT